MRRLTAEEERFLDRYDAPLTIVTILGLILLGLMGFGFYISPIDTLITIGIVLGACVGFALVVFISYQIPRIGIRWVNDTRMWYLNRQWE